MTAKSNIISLRAYAKHKARLIGPATQQTSRDHHWDTDDLKRLLFSDAGPVCGDVPKLDVETPPLKIIWN
jgi:hypothetical protein